MEDEVKDGKWVFILVTLAFSSGFCSVSNAQMSPAIANISDIRVIVH